MSQDQIISDLITTDRSGTKGDSGRNWPCTIAEYQALYGETHHTIHLDHRGDLDNRCSIEDYATILSGGSPFDVEGDDCDLFYDHEHYGVCRCKRERAAEIKEGIKPIERCYLFAWLQARGTSYATMSEEESELLNHLLAAELDPSKCDCLLKMDQDLLPDWSVSYFRDMSCRYWKDHRAELFVVLAEKLAAAGALDQLQQHFDDEVRFPSNARKCLSFQHQDSPLDSVLVSAARTGQTDVVRWALDQGARLECLVQAFNHQEGQLEIAIRDIEHLRFT